MIKDKTRLVSKALILTGILLLAINIVGLFHYKTIDETNVHIQDDAPRKISEQEFWDYAYKNNGENNTTYVNRLAKLVSDRMLLIDPKYAKPTLFENYILWAFSKYLNFYEWTNTQKAVRLGGGFCSQHAIVFNNILNEQGIKSRILGLSGHVLNEVLINGEWRVYDPDYNVVFRASLKDLESNPQKVYQGYKKAGRPEDEARFWQEVFGSVEDNWHYATSKHYHALKYLVEELSFFLIWIIPLVLIFIGIITIKYRLTRRST